MRDQKTILLAMFMSFPLSVAAQAPRSTDAPNVPLREGLTVVTAINNDRGDFESIKRVIHLDSKIFKVRYSVDNLPSLEDDNPLANLLGGGGCRSGEAAGGTETSGSVVRVGRREDLEKAHDYQHSFNICEAEEAYPGSTAIGLSASVLQDLKTRGEAHLRVPARGFAGTVGGLLRAFLGDDTDELDDLTMWSGTLRRVGTQTVGFAVLVNDQPVELPAIQARGRLGDDDSEFWILNDPGNPLTLRYRIGEWQLRVVKLSFPDGEPGPSAASTRRIERDLSEAGRVQIYGIYFDFASDRIKEESETVLGEIATVLRQNPTWSLAVEGHTDSIGGEAQNLDLSKRRAAAVKAALVERHGIDGTRLSTSGHGASRPQDRNDTLEGRARNRRVELVRR